MQSTMQVLSIIINDANSDRFTGIGFAVLYELMF